MVKGLDTIILVYALAGQDEAKSIRAGEVLKSVIEDPENYLVSSQVLAKTIYVVKRKAPELLEEAVRLVQLLSVTVRAVGYGFVEVLQASGSPARYFWDRLLAYTYANNGAEAIITEDEKPYKGIIKTINPFK